MMCRQSRPDPLAPTHPGRSRTMHALGLALAVALAALAAPARADVMFQFDPDGNGPDTTRVIGGFDYSVGNFLAQGLNPALLNWRPDLDLSDPTQLASVQFRGYYQATLAGLIDPNGNTLIPDGLNSSYQITAVAGVTLQVTYVMAMGGPLDQVVRANFAMAQDQTGSFVRMYRHDAVTANSLAGTGFTDGTLIAESLPEPTIDGTGAFVTQTTGPGVPLIDGFDQFGADDYAGTRTVVRTGSLVFRAANVYLDPRYFIEAPPELVFNTTSTTPFNATNPSRQFLGMTPDLGSSPRVNGLTGPDVVFQADGNARGFLAAVPEPATAGLAAAGALLLAAVAARRPRPDPPAPLA